MSWFLNPYRYIPKNIRQLFIDSARHGRMRIVGRSYAVTAFEMMLTSSEFNYIKANKGLFEGLYEIQGNSEVTLLYGPRNILITMHYTF